VKYNFAKSGLDAGDIAAQVAAGVGIKPDFVTNTEGELSIVFLQPLAATSEDKLRLVVRALRPDLDVCLKEGE